MSAGAALRTSPEMCPTVDVNQFVNGWTGVESVYPVVVDVTKLEDIERMVGEAESRFGKLECLLNIAGINDLSHPLDATDAGIGSWILI